MAAVKFKRGSLTSYTGLTTKDADTLYFVNSGLTTSGTGFLYLGEILISKNVVSASFSSSTKILTLTFNDGTTTTADFSDMAKASDVLSKLTGTPTVGDVVTVAADGQVQDSGKTIGGSTLSSTPNANTLATEAAVKDAIDTAVAGVYVVKGSDTVANISAKTSANAKVGDVYNVSDSGTISGQTVQAGDNVVCIAADASSTTWDKLSTTIDLSNYMTKVSSATDGNLAGLNASGQAVDSGYAVITTASGTPSSTAIPTEAVVDGMISSSTGNFMSKISSPSGGQIVTSLSTGEVTEGYDVETSTTTGADNTAIPTIGKVTDMVQNASVQWEAIS